MQREIGFHYLRMHGLLNDEMGVYTEDKQGNPQFNFQHIDTLYDALLKLHIRPFVELSALSAGTPISESEVTVKGGQFTRTMPLRTNDIFLLVLTSTKSHQ